jgi:hypothetical protein
MTHRGEEKLPQRYCRNCGARVGPSYRFCGVCGNRIAPLSPEDPQVIPEPVAAAQGPEARGRRSPLIFVGVVVIVLLAVGGALAFLGLGIGSTPPPDPAFDPLLKTLSNRTSAPIMLPAELPKELKNVAIDQDVEGDRYQILFLTGPPDSVTAPYIRVSTHATLSAEPEYDPERNSQFQVKTSEDVPLPDGTEAQLRYMVPMAEMTNYGPYWEGTFEKDGYIYTISVYLAKDGKEITRQALSTMVPAEDG